MDFRLQTLIPSSLTQDFILRSPRHLPLRGHNKPGLRPCRAAFPYKQRALLPVAEVQRLGLVEMPRHTCISVTWLHPAEWHVRRNAGNAQFQRARVKRHPHPGTTEHPGRSWTGSPEKETLRAALRALSHRARGSRPRAGPG